MKKTDEMRRIDFTAKDIGVMLLESITKGLYHDPQNSIREYVQNEYDANATEVRMIVAGDRLIIAGNGVGMNEDELISARRIGFSDKSSSSDVGFRGIGIWSGVAICDEVLISSKKSDDPYGTVIRIDAKGLRSDIEEGVAETLEGYDFLLQHGIVPGGTQLTVQPGTDLYREGQTEPPLEFYCKLDAGRNELFKKHKMVPKFFSYKDQFYGTYADMYRLV